MSEPARNHSELPSRPAAAPTPLRDWLAAMRAVAPEGKTEEPQAPELAAPEPVEERSQGWAPRLIVPAPKAEAQDDEIAEIVAENLMLKAKLHLEAGRQDELQVLLSQEIREMRAHIDEEIANFEDMRAQRDLWKARCEALMQPLFQNN